MGSQCLLRWNMWFILFRFCLFLVFVSLGMCLFICIDFQWLYNQDRLSLGRWSSSILFVHGTLLVYRDLFFSVTLYYFNNSLNYVSVYCMYRTAISEWWGVGVVICLERGADCLHMVQLMPLPHLNRCGFVVAVAKCLGGSLFWGHSVCGSCIFA